MIKENLVNYRNAHKEHRVLMSSVLGELDRISKTPTDEQCIATINKMMEANSLCGNAAENIVLIQFIPKKLEEDEIKQIIISTNFSNIGDCMKYFKDNYPGLYDGKFVSTFYKSL